MTVDDLCWDLLSLLICLRYQGPAKDPFLQTQWYMWYMWFLHIIAPVPVIALNALETPVNAFMAKRLQAALRSSGLQLSIWCDGYTAPMQCTPHKYIVTQGKSWKAVVVVQCHLETPSSWKKVDFAKLVSGHLFFEAPTSTQFVLFPCYASNKLTRYKFFET